MLQQILPVVGKMLPPATWLALLKYSPLPTSAQQDISQSIAQSQQNQQPDPEAAKAAAELQAQNAKAQAEIANHGKMTDAKIAAMAARGRGQAPDRAARGPSTRAWSMRSPRRPRSAPTAQPVHAGADAAALVMSVIGEMRRDMQTLANSINTPKQMIRDPQTGEITAVVPMQMPNWKGELRWPPTTSSIVRARPRDEGSQPQRRHAQGDADQHGAGGHQHDQGRTSPRSRPATAMRPAAAPAAFVVGRTTPPAPTS